MTNQFLKARDAFFSSTTAAGVFNGLCRIEDAALMHIEETRLHPCHGWESLKMELSMIRPMAEKYESFKNYLAQYRKNIEIADLFNVQKDSVSLFIYRLASIGVISKDRKLGSIWVKDSVNPKTLLDEFGSVMDLKSADTSMWNVRIKEALAKEQDDDPVVESLARGLFTDVIAACAKGESPRDAKDRLLLEINEDIRNRVDFRVWELQVRSMSA